MIEYIVRKIFGTSAVRGLLQKHFGDVPFSEIVTTARDFPITARVDVQAAVEELFGGQPGVKPVGLHSPESHDTPTIAQLLNPGPFGLALAPLQHDDVDTGEATPVRCLKNGLWLARRHNVPFAVLIGPRRTSMLPAVHLEVAVPVGEAGVSLSEELLRDLELKAASGRAYRGRIISLEGYDNFSGRGGAVKVHRLRAVSRDDVILPEATLTLLDRNVGDFVASRDRIKALRFSGRKGLLFYGPPGTGKTHTLHYLTARLRDHTTLLVSAEQVQLIGEYFRLARFLQPALIVVEDADLIARERQHMHNPFQEVMLNKLLNEMDGLREDADVLVILTTNRPEQLEPALTARPGRIDQAIEFPLPDDEGRAKLVALYSGGLNVTPQITASIVQRTPGASPAFIKELMRRSAQFQLERGGTSLEPEAVDGAIHEMLFMGGALNVKLLGGAFGANSAALETSP